jgi:hypothetical protein
MYKNNSGLIAKMKVCNNKKCLRLAEKLVHKIRYCSYRVTVAIRVKKE